jgi:cytochrome c553
MPLRIAGLLVLLTCPAWSASVAAPAAASPRDAVSATYTSDIRPLLTKYCSDCHSSENSKGDIDLTPLIGSNLTFEHTLSQAKLWQKVGSAVTAQKMPPAKAKEQPSDRERKALGAWLKEFRRLQPPDPGVTVMRRLSRSEYTNTIDDLFGLSVSANAGADLAADSIGAGFDNTLSPMLAEKYLLAADALLDRFILPDQMTLQIVPGQVSALIEGVEDKGKPEGTTRLFSTPADLITTANFPSDGAYTIRITAGAEPAVGDPIRLAIRLDGTVVGEVTVKAPLTKSAPLTVTAKLSSGRKALSILYVNPKAVETATAPAKPGENKPSDNKPVATKKPTAKPVVPKTRSVVIESIDIVGPPAKTPSDVQRRLFAAVQGKGLSRQDAARSILEPFATRAFRRPLRPDELAFLMNIFELGDSQDLVFNEAIKLALKSILISPQFLYRTSEELPEEKDRDTIAIGDYELASRLSYFLWGTMPDQELTRCAQEHSLHRPEVLAAQTKRLLNDSRIRHLAINFAAPWLNLDKLANLPVDEKLFPLMTKDMRQAMYDEGVAFFLGLLDTDNHITDVIDSDYAYVNVHTAKIYGLTDVKGTKMQKITLSDKNRGGVLTMAGVLAVTSMPSRTSPVKRGKFILAELLDETPPPPPANVPELNAQNTAKNAALTLRQRTELHRENPACASCHRVMDPLGFGLENFDAIGRWRDRDDFGLSVDSAGELPGKLRFSSPDQLQHILMGRKDAFVRTLTKRMLMFALGRTVSGYDDVVIDDISDAVIANGYHLDDLIQRMVASYPFLNRHTIK